MARQIEDAVSASGITLDDEAPPRTSWLCGLFTRRAPRSAPKPARVETATERAVFGVRKKQSTAEAASARLTSAAASVAQHADALGERASAARERARELMAVGKKSEAMLALKRSKALEKQAESASATRTALEQQLDVLESSALQREVAQALSASVTSTKQRTKGLLGRTETAVDEAQELKDFSDDIQQVLAGMQTDSLDEDELADELDAMVNEHEVASRETAPTVAPEPDSAAAVARKFPKAPTNKYARLDEIIEEGIALS
jgi:hypothetical protein